MATAAAALIAKTERDLQHEFLSRDAVRADRAIVFAPQGRLQRRALERWRAAGIIRGAKPGHYWLDVVAYAASRRARRRTVRVILLLAIAALIIVGLVAWLINPR